MLAEIRYTLRALARNPGFSAIAVLTLALGIGANTAIFTIFDGVLLRPLPFRHPERLVAIQEVFPRFARFGPSLPVTAWHFREWRKHNRSFEDLALIGDVGFTLTGNGEPRRIVAARVSASFFPILGIHPAMGRSFTEDEDRLGADRVVIIGSRLWRDDFRRDPTILGRKILLDGSPFEVVGVLGENVQTPTQGNLESILGNDTAVDLWKPFAIGDSDLAILAEFNYGCLGRLRPGVSIPRAITDLNAIQSDIVRGLPEKVELRTTIAPLQEQMTDRSRSSLRLLLAAAAAVLMIVVVNLANLMLARAGARRRELAVRAALGASMSRLIRQMLWESLILAGAGGVLGTLLAEWSLRAIVVRAPLELPGVNGIRLDWGALAFAAAVSVASGLLFGAAPWWRLSRTDPQDALKSGGRALTEDRSGSNLRKTLIAGEVALSAVCLVIAGLLLNSFVRLIHVDKGFQANRAMVVGLSLPAADYPDSSSRVRFVRTLVARVESLPGVVAAGVSNRGPLSGEGSNLSIDLDGAPAGSERPIVDYRCVTPDFFRAIGIPLVSGRLIAESDGERPVAVVSAGAARRLWPGRNPLGQHFRLGGDFAIEVVGVVGDVRSSLQKSPTMTVYVPFWQRDRSAFALHVRTNANPLGMANAVRSEIRRLDPELVTPQFRTLDGIVDGSVAQRRFQLGLILGFAVTAMLLAALGVYGVVSQAVAQRTNEIGIRLALGAKRSDVWRLIARQALTPVLGGLSAGLASAALAARFVSGFLFGVAALDPLTFAGVAIALCAAGIAACLFPAWRAGRVAPVEALRYE